jgi:hypothetical protein
LIATLLHCRPDGARIVPVVFVASHKRLHRLAGQQLDLMTHRREPPRPVLGTAAGSHANETRGPVGKVFEELLTPKLQVHDFSGLPIDPVQLKYPFGDINAHYVFATIHFGPSGLPVKIPVSSTLGALMPSAREGPPSTHPHRRTLHTAGRRRSLSTKDDQRGR